MTSIAPERISISAISSACSPLSGWETRRLSVSTPSFFAYSESSACSASMNAARPPVFWAWAMTWRERVVLPEDSGPKISTTRPRGMPPMPSAASTASEPVGITAMADLRPLAEPHDRALAELALDLSQRRLDGAPFFVGFHAGHVLTFLDGKKNFRAFRAIIDFGRAPQDAMRTEGSSLRHDPVSMSQARRAFAAHPVAAFFATGFGSGLSPVAPGTAGSLVGLALAWIAARSLASHTGSVGVAVGLLTSGLAGRPASASPSPARSAGLSTRRTRAASSSTRSPGSSSRVRRRRGWRWSAPAPLTVAVWIGSLSCSSASSTSSSPARSVRSRPYREGGASSWTMSPGGLAAGVTLVAVGMGAARLGWI